MEGAVLAAERRRDEYTTMAYQAAVFRGASQTKGGAKPLSHYLIHKTKRRQQTASEMLAVLREFKERGATMTFKQMN